MPDLGAFKKQSFNEYQLFNFHTDSIEDSYAYLKGLGYPIETDIVRFDDFSFFTVRDQNGNKNGPLVRDNIEVLQKESVPDTTKEGKKRCTNIDFVV